VATYLEGTFLRPQISDRIVDDRQKMTTEVACIYFRYIISSHTGSYAAQTKLDAAQTKLDAHSYHEEYSANEEKLRGGDSTFIFVQVMRAKRKCKIINTSRNFWRQQL
jgi:hypothetical protein